MPIRACRRSRDRLARAGRRKERPEAESQRFYSTGGRMMKPTRWVLMAVLATGSAFAARSAGASECANVHASRDALRASFQCNMDLRSAQRPPILLVPGTTLKPDENFAWNYVPALDARGWPVCTVETPENTLANIQLAAEYIEFAIRE